VERVLRQASFRRQVEQEFPQHGRVAWRGAAARPFGWQRSAGR
jgi:hypothetical protein